MSNDRLKFRAWDKRTKQFYPYSFSLLGEALLLGALEGWLIEQDPEGGRLARLAEVEIVQWTGLYDRDGNEVFEGDVIRHPDGDTAVIEYDLQHSGFRASYSSHASGMVSLQVSERGLAVVVGNVHENPDLMERANG